MRGRLLIGLLLLTSCSKPAPESPRDTQAYDVAEPAPAGSASAIPESPGISVSAAPGVAFNYRYAFRLGAPAVAGVQEQHAQMCEKLGLDRCRITGMRYRLVNDRDISAMLAFKLDPAIARAFGKDAIAAVQKAQGMLVDSEISGEDVGSRIEQSQRDEGRIADDLAAIEKRLAQPGLPAAERAELQQQAEMLRQQRRALRAGRDENRAALATTPMVFEYGSGDLVPGFNGRSTLRTAFASAGENFMWALGLMIMLVGTIMPWALIGAILFFGIRRITPWLDRMADRKKDGA